ncbi:MAG TPA: HAMP domain-containing sensor histidine kinase [Flavisolibacter sp.]|jgi:two-component system phosphate regulon sensor histidine kinase PhoR|nr:HAMP domain-containing sensor histidine kinase [Flavisolibacter sp.]
MVVRSRTLRLGIFISTFIIAAILIFQLIWLKKVYLFEQKQFDHSIAKVVRGLLEDLDQRAVANNNLNQLVVNPNSQTFFVKMQKEVTHQDSTTFYLQSELEDEDIFTDCYLGIYNNSRNNYTYTAYLPSATGSVREQFDLPRMTGEGSYLTLYFPHRQRYILSLMNFWIISSVVLLIVLILFGGSLYYFYRQRFLNETQKDFVNNFTHEFKTPVSVINLAAEVLANPSIAEKPEKLARYASIVQYQGKYLQDQIERLLRHAHSESNLLHLNKQVVSLHELVDEALNNLQPLIQEKNAEIGYDFSASHPEVLADKGYLLIVITNLVENAIKYSKNPRIIISTANENGTIVLSVRDNGTGIEKKYRDRIFKKFYRIPHGEQMAVRGFGLGLAFVKRIIQSHHGSIRVESIPGIGSDFQVKLPLS